MLVRPERHCSGRESPAFIAPINPFVTMPIPRSRTEIANRLLRRFGVELVRRSHLTHYRAACVALEQSRDASLLPPGADDYLRPDSPRLAEFRQRYRSALPPVMSPSRWTDEYKARTIDLRFFRSHNSYVFSDANWEFKYVLTAYYLKAIDNLRLFDLLVEDGLFGCPTLVANGTLCSRDLLDSIVELYFLERTLSASSRTGLKVLDIGAGYGRLAHRFFTAFPSTAAYLCADTVPESTFLCEYYLRYRVADSRVCAVPFDELERALAETPIDLAVNIHSFSECTQLAVAWWLDLLQRHRVRYLMIAPNADDHGGNSLVTQETNGERRDFLPLLTSRGYKLIEKRPKYEDPLVQRYGLSSTYHYLFELQ